jgi:transcriptional regulator with XRE-family HTH domain
MYPKRRYPETKGGPIVSNLKKLREEKGLTVRQLGKALDMPFSTISNYEQGLRTPKFSTANKIAEYFKVPIEEIFPEYQRTAPYPKTIKT